MSMRSTFGIVLLLLVVFAVALVVTQQSTPLPDEQLAGDLVELTVETAEETASTVGEFLNRLITAPRSPVVRILLIFAGIALLLAGWRISDHIIVVAGVVIGAMVALSLLTTDNVLVTAAAVVIGGLIGAALGVFLYYVAVFVIGAYIGILLTGAIADAISTAPASELILLAGGIVGGLILLGLSFQFLVLLSALVGAQMLSLGLGLPVVWTVIFAVVGVIVQFALMRTYDYDFRGRRRAIANP